MRCDKQQRVVSRSFVLGWRGESQSRWIRGMGLVLGLCVFLSGCAGAQLPSQREGREETVVGGERNDGGAGEGELDGGVWENQPLRPWVGWNPDAGLPKGHTWGKEERGKGFVQRVLSFQPAEPATFGQSRFPGVVKGAPEGLGKENGSLHVVSLGCGGSIVMEFSAPWIGNGPGPDFLIFENAFGAGDEGTFTEPAEVSVSLDGNKWHTFPCKPGTSSWPFPQCAGVRPVLANSKNKRNPHDPKEAGGDAFDLEELGLPYARFLRIVDKSEELPDAAKWCGGAAAGFDLDAVSVIWGFQPPGRPR